MRYILFFALTALSTFIHAEDPFPSGEEIEEFFSSYKFRTSFPLKMLIQHDSDIRCRRTLEEANG